MIQIIIQSDFTRSVNDLFQTKLSDSDIIGIGVVGTSAILFLILLYVIYRSRKNDEKEFSKKSNSPHSPGITGTEKYSGEGGDKVEKNQPENEHDGCQKVNDKPPEVSQDSHETKKGGTGSNETKLTTAHDEIISNDPVPFEEDSKEPLDKLFEEEIRKIDDRKKQLECNLQELRKITSEIESSEAFDEPVITIPGRRKNLEPLDDIIEKEGTDNELLHIGYPPTDKFQQPENWEYAVVKMPKKGSVIKQPVEDKQQIRGYKEGYFQGQMESLLGNSISVSGNSLISTGDETRPYEPDIFLPYLGNGDNIFIDIEIDEPYGGVD